MLILALRREILSAVVAVLQEAAVHPSVGDRNALNLYSIHFVVPSGLAQQIAVPELRQQVTDITGTLSTSEQQSLTQQLQDITHKTRAQVAVLVVPSTGDDSIEQYATRVFDSWKLGDKQRNDGILLLVAREDHAVRIEVGYGLEGVVTDLQAAKIIRDILIPAFKSDDLMGGLTLASENIGALLLNGELPEDRGIITVSIPYSIIACCNYIAGGTFIFYCFYRSVEFTSDHSHWRHLRDGIPLCCRAGTMDQFNRCLRYVNAFCDRTTGYFLAYRQ